MELIIACMRNIWGGGVGQDHVHHPCVMYCKVVLHSSVMISIHPERKDCKQLPVSLYILLVPVLSSM